MNTGVRQGPKKRAAKEIELFPSKGKTMCKMTRTTGSQWEEIEKVREKNYGKENLN